MDTMNAMDGIHSHPHTRGSMGGTTHRIDNIKDVENTVSMKDDRSCTPTSTVTRTSASLEWENAKSLTREHPIEAATPTTMMTTTTTTSGVSTTAGEEAASAVFESAIPTSAAMIAMPTLLTESAPQAPLRPTKEAFFGREKELLHLRSVWRHINDDQPIFPAALVWGMSGTGKSELIDQFLSRSCCTCGGRDKSKQPSLLPTISATAATSAAAMMPIEKQQQRRRLGTIQRCSCCYVLRGKYDEFIGSKDPFSAITQALDDFAMHLQHESPAELLRIQRCIEEAFSADASSVTHNESETSTSQDDATSQMQPNTAKHSHSALSILTAVVPSLSVLLPDSVESATNVQSSLPSRSAKALRQRSSSNNDTNEDGSHGNSSLPHVATGSTADNISTSTGNRQGRIKAIDNTTNSTIDNNSTSYSQSAWNRFCYIFIQFMKAISTPQRPVFLFLDDLQWSSAASLELLASLLTDVDLRNFMLLSAIRQEIDPHVHQAKELSPWAPLHTSFLNRLLRDNSAGADNAAGGKLLEQITLGDLSLKECIAWLSQLLHRSLYDTDLKILTFKIFNKTHGNVYFTLQAIEELMRREILVYSHAADRWEWDTLMISSHSNSNGNGNGATNDDDDLPIGDNIVAIVEQQLKQLPQELQYVLSVASYIRSTFDLPVLRAVLQYVDDHGGVDMAHIDEDIAANAMLTGPPTAEPIAWTTDRLYSVLERALMEGLVTNSTGETRYHFAHDRVQQAAHGLVPPGWAQNKLRSQIGRCLLTMYRQLRSLPPSIGEQDLSTSSGPNDVALIPASAQSTDHTTHETAIRDVDSLLFIAADHLNSARMKDHLFLVAFNVEVGRKALQMGAFATASGYLEKASKGLERVRNPWEEHYTICLHLFQCRAETELIQGNFAVGYRLANEIVQRARTFDEKLRIHLCMANALGREDRVADSLKTSLSVARKLGEFPKRFYRLHVIRDFTQIKSFLKKNTDEDIMNLPLQRGYRKKMAMKFIGEIGVRSYLAGDSLQWLVHALKLICMTIQSGIGEESPASFATLANMFDMTNEDRGLVMRCAGIANKMLQKVGGPVQTSWVNVIMAGSIYASSEPSGRCVHMFDRGYSLAMQAGDFELGLIALQSRNTLAFFFGYKLRPLVKAYESALQLYSIYNLTLYRISSQTMLMLTQYLAGVKPIDWDGIEHNLQRDAKCSAADPKELNRLINTYAGTLLLAMLFRRHDLVRRIMHLYSRLPEHAKSYYITMTATLVQGLLSSAMYRQTGKAKHKKQLKRLISATKTLIAAKGGNATSLLQLLKAELLSLKSTKSNLERVRRTDKAYNAAIGAAEKSALTHFCAIACECAAEYLIRQAKALSQHNSRADFQAIQLSMEELSCNYMTRAVECYKEWGCPVKVKDIQDRRSQYLKPDTDEELQGLGTPSTHDVQAARVVEMDNNKTGFTAGTVPPPSMAPQSNLEGRRSSFSRGGLEGDGGLPLHSSSHRTENDADGPNDHLSVLTDASG